MPIPASWGRALGWARGAVLTRGREAQKRRILHPVPRKMKYRIDRPAWHACADRAGGWLLACVTNILPAAAPVLAVGFTSRNDFVRTCKPASHRRPCDHVRICGGRRAEHLVAIVRPAPDTDPLCFA